MRCGSHLFRQLLGQLFGSQGSGIFIAKRKREYAADVSTYMYSYVCTTLTEFQKSKLSFQKDFKLIRLHYNFVLQVRREVFAVLFKMTFLKLHSLPSSLKLGFSLF